MKRVIIFFILVMISVSVFAEVKRTSRGGVTLAYDTSIQNDLTIVAYAWNNNDYSVNIYVTIHYTNGRSNQSWGFVSLGAGSFGSGEPVVFTTIRGTVDYIVIDRVERTFNGGLY